MQLQVDRDDLLRRFLAYVRIETTSNEENQATPSSECQWQLARLLETELKELGLSDVLLDEHCYVYAHLPEAMPAGAARAGQIPAVGLIAHMDVSPAVSGKDVKPIVHRAYPGGPITLPGDASVVLTPEADPPLGDCVGLDIVTSDGTTLLGADDKAGIAVILSLLRFLKSHPEVPHGPLYVAFTPDEEVGRGVAKFNLERFAAEVAYTVDGKGIGEIEDETFCADTMEVIVHGVNVHPGYAKGKMVNAIKLLADFIAALPREHTSPETTDGRQSYVHPMAIKGNEERAEAKLLIRDFTMPGLAELEQLVERTARGVVDREPRARLETTVTHSYKNMKVVLDQRPEAAAFAEEAIRAAGLAVVRTPIRGGTDGARLSFMGLPTPNLSAGGYNFHGKREWLVVQHMEKAAEVCLRLVGLWAERGSRKGRLPPIA